MRDKIERLKQALQEIGGDIGDALEQLEEKVGDKPDHPGGESIQRALDDTLSRLETEEEGGEAETPSSTWEKLSHEIEEWEDDHPGFTLIIGRIAHALSQAGL